MVGLSALGTGLGTSRVRRPTPDLQGFTQWLFLYRRPYQNDKHDILQARCEGAQLKAVEAELSQIQRERLAFLEMRAFFTGELRRGDIEARYGIKPAAASRDLKIYRGLSPLNLD